jgi:hypothetical protein
MGPQEQNDDRQHPNDEAHQHPDQPDGGHSGEGAASAMRQMISQKDRKRHQAGEADDAAGHGQ